MKKRKNLPLIATLAFTYVAVWALQATGIVNDYSFAVIVTIGINIILATSLNLVTGFTGQFSLGHAGFMSIGAYTCALITQKNPTVPGFLLGVAAGATAAAVVGVLVGLPTLRLRGDYLAIATLGMAEIIREIGEKEILWAVSPSHPILRGLPEKIVIEHEEMYGEFFNIPDPDELVLISWFGGGNVFRSGLCYKRGLGKLFYFRPGHESFPIYYQKEVQQILINAANWAAPAQLPQITTGHTPQPIVTPAQ